MKAHVVYVGELTDTNKQKTPGISLGLIVEKERKITFCHYDEGKFSPERQINSDVDVEFYDDSRTKIKTIRRLVLHS